jgi:hypothetical protein
MGRLPLERAALLLMPHCFLKRILRLPLHLTHGKGDALKTWAAIGPGLCVDSGRVILCLTKLCEAGTAAAGNRTVPSTLSSAACSAAAGRHSRGAHALLLKLGGLTRNESAQELCLAGMRRFGAHAEQLRCHGQSRPENGGSEMGPPCPLMRYRQAHVPCDGQADEQACRLRLLQPMQLNAH